MPTDHSGAIHGASQVGGAGKSGCNFARGIGGTAECFLPAGVCEAAEEGASGIEYEAGSGEKSEKPGCRKNEAIEEKLGRDFVPGNVRNGAAQRLGARDGKGHIPEIDFAGEKLDTEKGLAIALALNGHNPRFHFTGVTFVDNDDRLTDHQRMLGFDLRAVLADSVRFYVDAELLPVFVMAVHRKRHSQ
jgi:hypothetical protein